MRRALKEKGRPYGFKGLLLLFKLQLNLLIQRVDNNGKNTRYFFHPEINDGNDSSGSISGVLRCDSKVVDEFKNDDKNINVSQKSVMLILLLKKFLKLII